jgi:hypothetical protein
MAGIDPGLDGAVFFLDPEAPTRGEPVDIRSGLSRTAHTRQRPACVERERTQDYGLYEDQMAEEYTYTLAQCDVPMERHSALQSYRDKRRLWLSWITTDEHHAIWTVLSSMVWTDVAFKTLTNFAVGDEENALNNHLMAEALLHGHVATQVLAIRRLVDDRNRDIISLRRLVKDMRRNFTLFTRENYVCFDGLPYDYEAVQLKEMMERAGKGAFWGETSGPGAHITSRMAHQQFDKLAGIDPAKRSREDHLPTSLLTTIEKWLDDSGADDLAEWSHAYLAHAGGPEARKGIDHLKVTANKITDAIEALARVTEAVSAWLLFAGGRTNALMPVAQFNQFEKLDKPIMQVGGEAAADEIWQQLSDERNRYLDDVGAELIGRAKAQRPDFRQYKNDPELLSDLQGWRKQEIEKILGRKIDLPQPVQYSDRQHIVYWVDPASGKVGRFPPEGSPVPINEWHAMIVACSVVNSQTLDAWITDENGVRVADRKKIADFAKTHGYL